MQLACLPDRSQPQIIGTSRGLRHDLRLPECELTTGKKVYTAHLLTDDEYVLGKSK